MKYSVSKIDIALVHLRTAVQLYKQNNVIASITLASAAEEILGQMAYKKSGNNSLVEDKISTDQVADFLNKPRISVDKNTKARYKVKNELKHNDEGDDYLITADFHFQAETFLLGALRNYELLTGQLPKDRVIRNWYNTLD